jgi:hypothetical protein
MASKAKPKGKAKAKKPAGKRWLIVLAFTAFWAAVNEPGQLSMGAAIVWGLTALSVAFLVMAGLALLGPALVLLIRALPRPKPDEADET